MVEYRYNGFTDKSLVLRIRVRSETSKMYDHEQVERRNRHQVVDGREVGGSPTYYPASITSLPLLHPPARLGYLRYGMLTSRAF